LFFIYIMYVCIISIKKKMSLAIKLKRISLKKKISYKIVVVKQGERKVLDTLGFYLVSTNGLHSDKVICRFDRLKLYRWMSAGAKISCSLKKIFVSVLK